MKTKLMLSLSLLTLGVCSLAMAAEYVTPEVGFKKKGIPSKEMKVSEFGDYYKVEGAAGNTDRQIASEAEPSDREPSSVIAIAKDKKKPMDEKVDEPTDAPKPWLYKEVNPKYHTK